MSTVPPGLCRPVKHKAHGKGTDQSLKEDSLPELSSSCSSITFLPLSGTGASGVLKDAQTQMINNTHTQTPYNRICADELTRANWGPNPLVSSCF